MWTKTIINICFNPIWTEEGIPTTSSMCLMGYSISTVQPIQRREPSNQARKIWWIHEQHLLPQLDAYRGSNGEWVLVTPNTSIVMKVIFPSSCCIINLPTQRRRLFMRCGHLCSSGHEATYRRYLLNMPKARWLELTSTAKLRTPITFSAFAIRLLLEKVIISRRT